MSSPTYSVPGKYKPLIEAEQARLALPSKSETLGAILDFYFAKAHGSAPAAAPEQAAEQAPGSSPQPAAPPAHAAAPAGKWEVYISYVEARP